MKTWLVRNVRVWGSSATSLAVAGDRFVAPDDRPRHDVPEVDGRGLLALPGFVDAHAHADKTLLGLPHRDNDGGAGVAELADDESVARAALPGRLRERAVRLLDLCLRAGTTVMRTHVDVDTRAGLANLTEVCAAREQFADRMAIQIVAFPQSGVLRRPGTAALLDEAMRSGADAVGGIDPAGLDGDPVAHLDLVFDLAQRYGAPVDIHLHDAGTLGAWEIRQIAARTRALGMAGRVTVSHAMALATVPHLEQGKLLDLLADQRISVATVAPGRGDMIPVKRLLDHGVNLCLGNDGVRDMWSPYGDGDMLSRASLLAYRSGMRVDADIETALVAATFGGARAVGVDGYGLRPGDRADFVLVDGETVAEAVVSARPRALVVRAGRVVASDGSVNAPSPGAPPTPVARAVEVVP